MNYCISTLFVAIVLCKIKKTSTMDDNMMKDNIASKSKRNSMAEAILVRWKWNDHDSYRTFLGLRYGGAAETRYDLSVKYSEKSNEKITVLVYADQVADLSREEQVKHVVRLLTDKMWKWDPSTQIDFHEKVNRLLKTKTAR